MIISIANVSSEHSRRRHVSVYFPPLSSLSSRIIIEGMLTVLNDDDDGCSGG
jgi:hypothetical protein